MKKSGILILSIMFFVFFTLACGTHHTNDDVNGSGSIAGSGSNETLPTAVSDDQNSADPPEKRKLTIAFRDDGRGCNNEIAIWIQKAYDSYERKDEFELDISPVVSSEGEFFSRMIISMRSEKTAPDIVTEDTFILPSDVRSGYLTPLDEYLKDYDDWKNGAYIERLVQGVSGEDGHIYGIPYNTDSRGIWYNKEVFEKAGLPTEWAPKSWAEILEACEVIKKNLPEVIPLWCNSSTATGEATSMQTYEQLLYGTGEQLLDEDGKWIIDSPGIRNSLEFIEQVFSNNYGPSMSMVMNGEAGSTYVRDYFPSGKLAMSFDGNWIVSNYFENGMSTWPEYSEVLNFVPMPTMNGDGDGTITLAGGWAWSIPALSDEKDLAMDFIKHLMEPDIYVEALLSMNNIGSRNDLLEQRVYSELPFVEEAISMMDGAYYRPQKPEYSSVSGQIQLMVEAVVSGKSVDEAVETYGREVTKIVGEENVVKK